MPKTLGEAAALTGKMVQIELTDTGCSIRMRTEFEPAQARYWVTITGEVTGYHMTRSQLVNSFMISIAGWGAVDVLSSTTKIYRVVPSWWQRALIWLGLMPRPHWY